MGRRRGEGSGRGGTQSPVQPSRDQTPFSKGAQVSGAGSRLILDLLEMLLSGFKIQCLD